MRRKRSQFAGAITIVGALVLVFVNAAHPHVIRADEPATPVVNAKGKDGQKFPAPLDMITYDLGILTEHFTIVECKYYAADEFTAGDRLAAEETVAWRLEAKLAMKGDAVFRLLHPNPVPNLFAKVRFEKTADGKIASADARADGYSLIRDFRWVDLKRAPDLAAGDKLQVWIHLGKEGSAGLLANDASRMVIAGPNKSTSSPR